MPPLGDVARLFLLLGTTAFGGPAAHVAMMHDHVVRRRRWLTDAAFADLVAAVNLIPGPNSTELAIHVGRRVAGWPGFAVAGVCFIAPAALIVSALASVYVKYGSAPDARAAMAGVAPVIIAIIAHAAWQLGRSTLKTTTLWLVAGAAGLLSVFGVNELLILAVAGAATAAHGAVLRTSAAIAVAASASTAAAAGGAAAAASVSTAGLFLFFLKVGSVLFGSGYVLLAFLRADLVERWGWLTERQLLDAIAVGQFTPGPVFTTATFIGYLLGGWIGAVLSTLGIFLPAFVFVAITHPIIPRLRASTRVGALLDGVVAASLGLMVAVAFTIMRTSAASPASLATIAASLAALAVWRVNSVWLVLAGAVIGLIMGGWTTS